MKVLKNKQKGYTTALEIEVGPDSIVKMMELAFKKLVKKSKIPGFRQGKAPRHVFEENYGKDMLVQEGLTEAVNEAYVAAIQELKLDVVDYPKDIKIGKYEENEPVMFSCSVDVKPDVKLGKYKGIKVTRKSEVAPDQQLEDKLNKIRENEATFTEVTRPSQDGDVLRFDLKAHFLDGTPYQVWSRKSMGAHIGKSAYGPDFDKQVTGLNINEKKCFSVKYPEDHAQKDLAGKTLDFEINVTEIREKCLPKLTDEMIDKVAKGKTLPEYKDDLKKELDKQAKRESEETLKNDLVKAVVENAKVDIPIAMIEKEIDQDIHQYEHTLKQSKMSIDQYLSMIQKTKEELRAELKVAATQRCKTTLVLDQVTASEKFELTEQDLRVSIREMVPELKSDEEADQHLKKIHLENFKNLLKSQKTVDFLVEKAKISHEK